MQNGIMMTNAQCFVSKTRGCVVTNKVYAETKELISFHSTFHSGVNFKSVLSSFTATALSFPLCIYILVSTDVRKLIPLLWLYCVAL